ELVPPPAAPAERRLRVLVGRREAVAAALAGDPVHLEERGLLVLGRPLAVGSALARVVEVIAAVADRRALVGAEVDPRVGRPALRAGPDVDPARVALRAEAGAGGLVDDVARLLDDAAAGAAPAGLEEPDVAV